MRTTHKPFPVFLMVVTLFTTASAYTQDTVSTRLHFAFIEATGPRPPFMVDDKVVFTYQQGEPARFVAAAFAHEDFTVMHPFKRYTPEGGSEVFVLAYDPPPAEDTLIYRVIVDGLWMSDPANSDRLVDVSGTSLSRYRIPQDKAETIQPEIGENGAVTFVYRTAAGSNVTVAGTFNAWDPFMYPMRETSPGRYERTIFLSPGEYVYHFVVNGNPFSDPENPRERFDASGNRYSYFFIEREQLPAAIEPKKKTLRDRIPFLGGS